MFISKGSALYRMACFPGLIEWMGTPIGKAVSSMFKGFPQDESRSTEWTNGEFIFLVLRYPVTAIFMAFLSMVFLVGFIFSIVIMAIWMIGAGLGHEVWTWILRRAKKLVTWMSSPVLINK